MIPSTWNGSRAQTLRWAASRVPLHPPGQLLRSGWHLPDAQLRQVLLSVIATQREHMRCLQSDLFPRSIQQTDCCLWW